MQVPSNSIGGQCKNLIKCPYESEDFHPSHNEKEHQISIHSQARNWIWQCPEVNSKMPKPPSDPDDIIISECSVQMETSFIFLRNRNTTPAQGRIYRETVNPCSAFQIVSIEPYYHTFNTENLEFYFTPRNFLVVSREIINIYHFSCKKWNIDT